MATVIENKIDTLGGRSPNNLNAPLLKGVAVSPVPTANAREKEVIQDDDDIEEEEEENQEQEDDEDGEESEYYDDEEYGDSEGEDNFDHHLGLEDDEIYEDDHEGREREHSRDANHPQEGTLPVNEIEELRLRYEKDFKSLLDTVINTLPITQLDYFNEFFLHQQHSFSSYLLSQKVNRQYQRCIRRNMRQEIKRCTTPTNPPVAGHQPARSSTVSFSDDTQTVKNPIIAVESSVQNPSILAAAASVEQLRSAITLESDVLPLFRQEFYYYAQQAVECVSKEQHSVNDFAVTMEIVWRILPYNYSPTPPATSSESTSPNDTATATPVIPAVNIGSLKKKKGSSEPVLLHCHYDGDNEGNGRYRWEIGKYSQEYEDFTTPTNVKLSGVKHQPIAKMFGLPIEDCSQLVNWIFVNSFWIDA